MVGCVAGAGSQEGKITKYVTFTQQQGEKKSQSCFERLVRLIVRRNGSGKRNRKAKEAFESLASDSDDTSSLLSRKVTKVPVNVIIDLDHDTKTASTTILPVLTFECLNVNKNRSSDETASIESQLSKERLLCQDETDLTLDSTRSAASIRRLEEITQCARNISEISVESDQFPIATKSAFQATSDFDTDTVVSSVHGRNPSKMLEYFFHSEGFETTVFAPSKQEDRPPLSDALEPATLDTIPESPSTGEKNPRREESYQMGCVKVTAVHNDIPTCGTSPLVTSQHTNIMHQMPTLRSASNPNELTQWEEDDCVIVQRVEAVMPLQQVGSESGFLDEELSEGGFEVTESCPFKDCVKTADILSAFPDCGLSLCKRATVKDLQAAQKMSTPIKGNCNLSGEESELRGQRLAGADTPSPIAISDSDFQRHATCDHRCVKLDQEGVDTNQSPVIARENESLMIVPMVAREAVETATAVEMRSASSPIETKLQAHDPTAMQQLDTDGFPSTTLEEDGSITLQLLDVQMPSPIAMSDPDTLQNPSTGVKTSKQSPVEGIEITQILQRDEEPGRPKVPLLSPSTSDLRTRSKARRQIMYSDACLDHEEDLLLPPDSPSSIIQLDSTGEIRILEVAPATHEATKELQELQNQEGTRPSSHTELMKDETESKCVSDSSLTLSMDALCFRATINFSCGR